MNGNNNNRSGCAIINIKPNELGGNGARIPGNSRFIWQPNWLARQQPAAVAKSHPDILTGSIKYSLLLPLYEKVFAHSYHKVKLLIVIACGYI